MRLEALFTSRNGFGVESATPLQRALCRATDGEDLGDLWNDASVRKAFGVRPPVGCVPLSVLVLAAIRSGKSTLAAARAFAASQTVDLTGVKSGDEIRIPILSIDKDSARATFTHVAGAIVGSPSLRKRLIGSPTADSLWLRHPLGAPIEIKTAALARYGSTVISRWLAGVIFDEAPRMGSEDDSVRNLNESRRASAGRILPGGQTWMIGSPWSPVGPIYDLVTEHEGKPSRQVVVIRAPGPAMNPTYWTPERCDELRVNDPHAYKTDVLAEFADPPDALFASSLIERAQRSGPEVLPPHKRVNYVATLDPATRSPNWTLIIAGNYGLGGPGGTQPILRIALAKQWLGNQHQPLNPDRTMAAVAKLVKRYRLDECITDPRAIADLYDIAERHGIQLVSNQMEAKDRLPMVESLGMPLSHGTLDLPHDRQLRNDLVGVRKRVTLSGFALVLPKTGEGRHADYVLPLAACYAHAPEAPEAAEPERDEVFEAHMAALRERSEESEFAKAAGRLM